GDPMNRSMMNNRLGGCLAIAALMLPLVAGAGSAAAAGAAPGTPPAALIGRTVTLITGDRVTVADDGRMSISAAKGRDGVRFMTTRVGGHLRVIPSDALALLRADRLDGRLFDVTTLLDFGYDRRTALPLIVTNKGGGCAPASVAGARGARGGRDLPAGHGLAVPAAPGPPCWPGLSKA